MLNDKTMKVAMKTTGIGKLDQFINGGVPEGKSMLFYTSPGVENDIFGYQTIVSRLKKDNVFCLINTTIPDLAKKTIYNYGWDVEEAEKNGKFFFIDACSAGIGMPGKGKYILTSNSADETHAAIINSIKAIKNGTGVINSLSSIVDSVGEKETLNLVKKWNELAAKSNANMVYLFTAWNYSKEFRKKLHDIMNSVVVVSGIEERIIIGQYFAVIKADWTKTNEISVLFQIARPGGVKVFIPKILITGPFNAGKSSFMHSLATRAVSVDRSCIEQIPTTVALDIGHVDYKSFQADLFGTPGQERFDLLLRPLGKEAIGVFIVVDSTKPESFIRAKEMIKKCDVEGLPKVVIANKQNMKNALTLEKVKKKLGLGKTPIVGVSVAPGTKFPLKHEPCPLNKKEALNALDLLLDQIYR